MSSGTKNIKQPCLLGRKFVKKSSRKVRSASEWYWEVLGFGLESTGTIGRSFDGGKHFVIQECMFCAMLGA